MPYSGKYTESPPGVYVARRAEHPAAAEEEGGTGRGRGRVGAVAGRCGRRGEGERAVVRRRTKKRSRNRRKITFAITCVGSRAPKSKTHLRRALLKF